MNEMRKMRIAWDLSSLYDEVQHVMNLLSIYDEHFNEKQERNQHIMDRTKMYIERIKRVAEI